MSVFHQVFLYGGCAFGFVALVLAIVNIATSEALRTRQALLIQVVSFMSLRPHARSNEDLAMLDGRIKELAEALRMTMTEEELEGNDES